MHDVENRELVERESWEVTGKPDYWDNTELLIEAGGQGPRTGCRQVFLWVAGLILTFLDHTHLVEAVQEVSDGGHGL